MVVSTSYLFILLMTVWSSLQYCLADELLVYPPAINGGGNTRPANTNNNGLDHQFIIEFERNELGEASKRRLFRRAKGDDDADLEVLQRLDSRNIVIVKFRDSVVAAIWRKNTKGVKVFERGRK